MDEIYVSIDIEADGLSSGHHSMLSFTSVAFSLDRTIHSSFERNLDLLPGATQHPGHREVLENAARGLGRLLQGSCRTGSSYAGLPWMARGLTRRPHFRGTSRQFGLQVYQLVSARVRGRRSVPIRRGGHDFVRHGGPQEDVARIQVTSPAQGVV